MTIEQNPGVSFDTMNMPYVTVTVCDQSGKCVNVDHVLVDTMSTGFRVFSSALTGLNLATPGATANNLAECVTFMSGYTWGPVKLATVKIAGEVATNVPIQVIADPSVATAPSACTGSGLPAYSTQSSFGANGILGVAVWNADGQQYFDCSSGSCQSVSAGVDEVSNTVAQFSSDNNGVMLTLPSESGTASSATGTLTFGVDTQADDSQAGFSVLTTTYNGMMNGLFDGKSYPQTFVDSGSNTLALTMPSMSTYSSSGSSWINPSVATAYSVQLTSATGSANYTSSVTLVPAGSYLYSGMPVMPNAAIALSGNPGMQDFGLPFFYGRTVAVTFSGQRTNEGTGPEIGFK